MPLLLMDFDAAMRSASSLWLLASGGLMTAMPWDAFEQEPFGRMQATIDAFESTTSEAAARRLQRACAT